MSNDIKKCKVCNQFKRLDKFATDNKTKDKLYYCCKDCKKESDIKYREENKNRLLEQKRRYHAENRETILPKKREYARKNPRTEYKRMWKLENKERLKVNDKRRRDEEPLYRLTINLRNRIQKVFKGLNKSESSKEILGVDNIQFVFNYIESLFQSGMNWKNYGRWHIDHKIPLCTAKSSIELKKLCHYTNLQPLWAVDNLRKSKKLFKG